MTLIRKIKRWVVRLDPFKWMDRFFCSLAGHRDVKQFEVTRVYLRCSNCGRETPGWDQIGAPPETVNYVDDSRYVETT